MEWTADRIALLKRLRDDGVSYAAIAAKLGITRGAVSGKVDRLGLAIREPAPRGPRQPRVRLKTRRRIDGPGSNPHPEVSNPHPEVGAKRASKDAGPCDAAPGRATSGPSILRDALFRSAPQDEGFRDVRTDPSARTSRACSLLELTEDTCRWPVGDPGEPGFFFCGQSPLKGAPYCGPHCRKAFRPVDAKPVSEFVPDRDTARVLQPDNRFGQFAHWDVT